jgi:hypothetical protein
MVWEVLVGAGDGFAADEILGLEIDTVGCQNELRLGFGGGGTLFQGPEGLR